MLNPSAWYPQYGHCRKLILSHLSWWADRWIQWNTAHGEIHRNTVGKCWQTKTELAMLQMFSLWQISEILLDKMLGYYYFYTKISFIIRSKGCKDSGNLKFSVNQTKEIVFKGLKLAWKDPSICTRRPCGCPEWPEPLSLPVPQCTLCSDTELSPLYRRTKLGRSA